MIDRDNVLLPKSLEPERGLAIYPAVGPVTEPKGVDRIAARNFSRMNRNSGASCSRKVWKTAPRGILGNP
jgi:hypothetical protein